MTNVCGVKCPECKNVFAVDEVENDDENYLSPCCRSPMGKR